MGNCYLGTSALWNSDERRPAASVMPGDWQWRLPRGAERGAEALLSHEETAEGIVESREYFDAVASRWDDLRASFFSDAVREKAFSLAQLQPGGTAADIGAGTGVMTEGLVRLGLKVIAIDQSAAMIEQMRSKFGSEPSIEYRQADAESLPLDGNAVDYVFANMYLHHAENPSRAIAEDASVLKEGGKLIVTDLDEHGFELLRIEQKDRWLGFKRPDVRAGFEDAGLTDVGVDRVGADCCANSESNKVSARASIFVAWGARQAQRYQRPVGD